MSTKILIVEDNPAVRQVYVRILSKLPVIVLQADNVDVARSLFLANPEINVVVLDGDVPGSISTGQLAQDIRQQGRMRYRLVAIVGNLEKCPDLVAVCNVALQKPIEKPEFLAALGLS